MSMPYAVQVESRDFSCVVSTFASLVTSGLNPELKLVVKLPTGAFRFVFTCIAEDGWKVEDALSGGSKCETEQGTVGDGCCSQSPSASRAIGGAHSSQTSTCRP